jgi:DUF971 family protein
MNTQPQSIDRVPEGIRILWDDGMSFIYSAQFLRQRCPCAVCRETPGHPPPQSIPSQGITLKAAHPIGRYALQFVFSDGHDTGIYSYEYLRKIGPEAGGST